MNATALKIIFTPSLTAKITRFLIRLLYIAAVQKSRRALRGLDQDGLNDIGVSQRQAEVEAKRPF
jgi:uncharacterized protein YjiS (DUF1127 family)